MSSLLERGDAVHSSNTYRPSRTDAESKFFWLADSFTSYPYHAEVYIGRQPGADRSRGSGPAILRRLSQPLENTGRNITVDNFFTDFQTARDFLAKRMTLVGTVRKKQA